MVDDPIEQRIRERRVQEQDGEAVADNAPVNTGWGNAGGKATAARKTQAQCRHIGGNNSTGTSGTDAVADNPLELVESGWSVSQQGYVSYAFALRNTSTTLQVQYPEVAITGEPKTAPSCSRRRKR